MTQVDLGAQLFVDRFDEVAVPFAAPGFVLPLGLGQFWRLRWDDEIPPDYKVRESAYNQNGGTPATRISREGAFVEMDAAHQNWRWEIWRACAPPEWVVEYDATPEERRNDTRLAEKFLQFFHSRLAWTNHEHGSDVRAVYPLKLNLKKPTGELNTPMAQQMLAPAGNVVLQIEPAIITPKATWIPCLALRPDELLPWNELKFMPWVLHCSTVQRIELEGDHHRVNRFPQLTTSGRVEYDVPLVLISNNGMITFNKDLLEPIEAGVKVPCPYHPARPFGRALEEWN